MDRDNIVERFGEFAGLPETEAEARRELCADAMGRVEAQRSGLPGGEGALEAYAAAMACRRFVLLCTASGGVLRIGEPSSGDAGALEAAAVLEEEYRRGAAPWLLPPEFCFRRTGGPL